MHNKKRTPHRVSRKWFQLSFALVLALGLLVIPVTAGTILRLPAPASFLSTSAGQTIELPLPFGAALVYATDGLTITKSAAELTTPGAILTYTLTISNFSSESLSNGFGDDLLPDGVTCDPDDLYISAPTDWNPTCDTAFNSVTWAVPSLLTETTAELAFRVHVSDSLPNGYEIVNENYQVSNGPSGDPPVYYPWDEGPPVTTTVQGPQWAITKTVSSQVTKPEEILIYTITATNVGQLATEGDYTISDSVPDNTTWAAGPNPPSWTFSDPLVPGATKTVSYSVQVNKPLDPGIEIVNSGYTVSGGNAYSSATNDPVKTTVVSTATLQISKVANPDPVQVGSSLVYTITVTNDADAAGSATALVITDTLPSGVTYQSAGFVGSASGTVDNPDSSTVVWAVGSPEPLPVGQSVQVTASVTINEALLPDPPVITNTYQASGDNAPLVTGSPLGTQLEPGDPAQVTVEVGSTELDICETTPVTVTFLDQGGNPTPGEPVKLTRTLFSDADALFSPDSGSTNAEGVFYSNLKATDGAGSLKVVGSWEEDLAIEGQSSLIGISDSSIPDRLTLDVSPNPLAAGGFTAVVTATVTDCQNPAQPKQYEPVTLTLDDTTLATFPGPPPDTATGTTDSNGQVSATVTSTTTQASGSVTITGTSGNLEDTTILNILGPELTLTKSADPPPLSQVKPGAAISYTLRVTNTGNIEVTGLRLTDTLPSLVNYVSVVKSTTGGGTVDGPTFPESNTVLLTLDKLEPDKVLEATLSVTVTATLSGTLLSNSAAVKSDQTALLTSNTVDHTVITDTVSTGEQVYLPLIIKEQ